MPGTAEGFKKTRIALIEKYGSEEAWRAHMKEIGAQGGRLSTGGGFATKKVGDDGLDGRARARKYGTLGGRKSKRKSTTQ